MRGTRLRTVLEMKEPTLSTDHRMTAKGGIGVRHLQILLLFLCLTAAKLSYLQSLFGHIDELVDKKIADDVGEYTDFIFAIIQSLAYVSCGLLSTKVNNKYLLVSSATVEMFLTFFEPNVAKYSSGKSCLTLKSFKMLTHGFVSPLVYNILAQWVTPDEEALLLPFVISGKFFAYGIRPIIGTDLEESRGGWESASYFSGNLMLVWIIAFVGLGAQEPKSCWYISSEERRYIEKRMLFKSPGVSRSPLPLKAIFRNVPTYALFFTLAAYHSGNSYVFQIMIADLKENITWKRAISQRGYAYITNTILVILLAAVTSFLISRNCVKKKTLRFVSTIAGLFLCALCSAMIVECGSLGCITGFIFFGHLVDGFLLFGALVNFFDLAPNFVGLITGLTYGFIPTIVIGMCEVHHKILKKYDLQIAKLINGQIGTLHYIIGIFAFMMFGKVEIQPYNFIKDQLE